MTFDINKELAKPEHSGSSRRGSQMGRRNRLVKTVAFIYLQRLRFVDGDYDTGGAYWGGGRDVKPVWAAASEDMTFFATTRAKDRNEAKKLLQALFRINETSVNWAK